MNMNFEFVFLRYIAAFLKKMDAKKIFLTQTLSIKLHNSKMSSGPLDVFFPSNLSDRYEVERYYMISMTHLILAFVYLLIIDDKL